MSAPSPYADALARVPVRERAVEVQGSTAQYWDYGPSDAARVVVAIHGLRGDHHGLEPLVAALPELRIVMPDLPGFGATPPLAGGSHRVADYAAWIDDFLTATGLRGTAVLLGHSFGSILVAHALALGVPSERVVLVNPIVASPAAGAGRIGTAITSLWYRIGAALPARAGRAWLSAPLIVRLMSIGLARTPDPQLRRWIHEEHARYFSGFASTRSVVQAFDASLSRTVEDAAAALTMPVLLVVGGDDPIAPPAHAARLAASLPAARVEVLDGVGHLIHYERPEDAAQLIRDFLTP